MGKPGHGVGTKVSGGERLTSIEDMGAWLLEFMDAVGIEKTTLVGSSPRRLLSARRPSTSVRWARFSPWTRTSTKSRTLTTDRFGLASICLRRALRKRKVSNSPPLTRCRSRVTGGRKVRGREGKGVTHI